MLLALGIVAMSLPNEIRISQREIPTIVVDAQAAPSERIAAKELAVWLGKVAGATLSVTDAPVAGKATIVVGPGTLGRKLFPDVDLSKLGPEELILRSKGNALLVAGGRPRGTVYAVNRLLHRQGIRWWTPWATTVPSRDVVVLKDLKVQEKPFFEARDPFWFHAFDRDWARRNNSNSEHSRLTKEDGGTVLYKGFVHTFNALVPPEKYFKTHPEWYSLIDGKRTADNAQLCTTNPELRDFIVEKVREWLKESPDASIVSISQNDCFNPCQCSTCKALDDAEGSNSASVLTLANYVAERIETEYPNVAIDTLAYQYTRKAPKSIKPRKNVIVRLCSIECNFAKPLTDASNASFAADIKDWSRLTQRLYIWNYVTDFPNYMMPFPNWYTVGPNERFFASNGVKGLFEQGAYQSYGSAMAEMHAWVQAQLLWKPFQDDRKLIAEFLRGYYGKAAKPIQEYLDLLADAAKDTNLTIWTGPDAPFFTLDTLLKAESLWTKAETMAGPEEAWRVRLGHLPLRYAILSRWVPLRREAMTRNIKWPLPESRKAVADEWMALATGAGPTGWSRVGMMNEAGLTPERWAERFAVDPAIPTRTSTAPALPADLKLPPGSEVVDLQDELAQLYSEGNLVEVRADKAASDGVACRMPGSHHEWAFQMNLTKAPEKARRGKWAVYVVVRTEPGSGAGLAFTAGLYSGDLKKGLGGIEVAAKDTSGAYRTYKVTSAEVTPGCYVWVAPTASDSVKGVWVDRVLLVRE